MNLTVKTRGDRPGGARRPAPAKGAWSEVLDADGAPRPPYEPLLGWLAFRYAVGRLEREHE